MIFQGQGTRALIEEQLRSRSNLNDWQLKNGSFTDLEFRERTITRMSTERAVMDETRIKNCHINECEFLQSNFQNAELTNSTLEETSFTSCQLRQSLWENSRLIHSRIRCSAAPKLILKKTTIENCLIEEVEVNRGSISDCCFFKTSLSADHPSGTTGFRNSSFIGCLFVSCSFSGTALAFTTLTDCVFLNCSFSNVDWECIDHRESSFTDCPGGPHMGYRPKEEDQSGSWLRFEQEILNG